MPRLNSQEAFDYIINEIIRVETDSLKRLIELWGEVKKLSDRIEKLEEVLSCQSPKSKIE